MRYGMHQISFWFFQRGITPEREKTRTRNKKRVSTIFPWGSYTWNFKTLSCTVLKIWHASKSDSNGRTHGRTTRNQYAPSTSSKLRGGGIKIAIAQGYSGIASDCNSWERSCDSPVEKLSLSSMVVGQIPQGYSGTASDCLHRGQQQSGQKLWLACWEAVSQQYGGRTDTPGL